MCGIAGIFSQTVGLTERELFEGLLMLNVYRGKDSTGVVRINELKKGVPYAQVKRAVVSSPGFVASKYGHDMLYDLDKKEAKDTSKTTGYIGHCRAATKGEIKVQNAHPFRFDHTIGVHNGTIHGSFKGSKDFETDSEALFNLINDAGIEEALNEVSYSDPAYALVYLDTKEKTLNFVRNDKRPLYFTYLYGKSTLVWSSRWEMIEFALDQRSTAMSKTAWSPECDVHGGYFTLKENNLLSIPLDKSPAQASITKLDVKVHKYSVGFRHSSMQHLGYYDWDDYTTDAKADTGGSSSKDGYGNFREKHGTDLSRLPWLHEQEESSKAGKAGEKADAKGNNKAANKPSLVSLRENTFKGEPVSTSERDFRLSQGCLCCGTPILPTDTLGIARVHWWNREHFACGDCYDNVTGDTDWVAIAIDNEIPKDAAKLVTAAGSVH